MNKKEARIFAKEQVKLLNIKDKFRFSAEISKSALNFILDKKAKSVFIYMSVSNEPSTVSLIQALQCSGITVYIPQVVGDTMLLSQLEENSSFVLNKFGIPELCQQGIEYYDCDINIIPLVGYDKNFNRVGHGKGYYDKYLERATGKNVALAFSCTECENIDCDSYDIKPDFIITEKGIISK